MKNKKAWMLGVGLVVALAGTSAVVAAEAATAYIGKEKAKQIALKEAPGKVTDIDLERKRSAVYYEVEIDRQDSGREVDVHVEAVTGQVLKVEDDDDNRRSAATSINENGKTTTSKTTDSKTTTQKNATTTPSITKEQASKLAQQAVKGEVVRVETDWDDGHKEYEVTLRTASGYAQVELSASSGKVLDIDYDDDDDDDHDDYDDDDYDDDHDDRD